MTLSKRELVCIIWDDAHHSMDEYTDQEIERDIHKPARLVLFGLLVKSDEKGVTLAMEETAEGTSLRHVFFVPRAMVVEEVLLGKPKRKVERKKKAPTLDQAS